MSDPKKSDSHDDDLDLVMALLRGFHNEARPGLMSRRKYLSGPRENAARAALVRILHENVEGGRIGVICLLLAELFASNDTVAANENPRRLDFVFRSQNHPNRDRDMKIAMHVWDRRKKGMSEENAVAAVADLTGLGDRQVRKICKRLRPVMERYRGPPPRRAVRRRST